MRRKSLPVLTVALALAAAGCADESPGAPTAGTGERPRVVVTTAILGDVVTNLVGDRVGVEVIMPPAASPHDFEPSARQAAAMRQAGALIANGAGFEAGMLDVIDAAREDGVATYQVISAVDTLQRSDEEAHGADEHHEAEEAPGAAGDGGVDPHFFTDPSRTAVAARGIVDFLATELAGPDARALRDGAAPYLAELAQLDAQVEDTVAVVPPGRRKLVTNHDVFGYFADRYGFEVLGTVIPGGSTLASPSPAELDELVGTIRAAQVPAIFADTSSPEQLADALADEVGDVAVVELYSEALGPPGSPGGTYLQLVRTNAQRIAEALAG